VVFEGGGLREAISEYLNLDNNVSSRKIIIILKLPQSGVTRNRSYKQRFENSQIIFINRKVGIRIKI
jgi:hypothetical protein